MNTLSTTRDEIERRKRASVGQLLFRCARLFNDEALRRVHDRTGMPMRASHTAVFAHLDFEGTRLTDLAQRMGVTKQAAGQLVDELEAMGALERFSDPRDGRAKLIRFAQHHGEHGVLQGLAVLEDVEAELAATMPKGAMAGLQRRLVQLLEVLEPSDERS